MSVTSRRAVEKSVRSAVVWLMAGHISATVTGPVVHPLKRDPRHTTRSFYRYIFAIDPQTFGAEHEEVCAALDAEGIDCWVGYEAMHNYSLFKPQLSKLPVPTACPERFQFDQMNLPEATRACEHEAVWLDEAIFRAGKEGVDDAVAAIKKVQRNSAELVAAKQAMKR